MKTIAITGYNRPQLFSQMLKSLSANQLDGWNIYIQLEPSSAVTAYMEAAHRHLSHVDYHIVINERRLGVRRNPFSMLNYVFNKEPEIVIYLEDDLLVAPDITELADWYCHNRPSNCIGLSLLAGGCGSAGFLSYPEHQELLFLSKAFNSLGFIITPEDWQSHLRVQWMMDYKTSRNYRGQPSTGWDWSIYHYLSVTDDLYTLCPVTARSTHTGREGGTHCTASEHDRAFNGLTLASKSIDKRNYNILEVDSLPALIRHHALLMHEMIAARKLTAIDTDINNVIVLKEENQKYKEMITALLRSRWRKLGLKLGICQTTYIDREWVHRS